MKENDLVVFWEVREQVGVPTPMYTVELDQIEVTLTEGSVKVTKPDGTYRIERQRFGSVRFESKGTVEQVEGLDENPRRTVVFQLKDAPAPHRPVVDGIPGQFPRLDTTLLFENARIRVWDQVWLPNRPVTNHLHYHKTVAVFLGAGSLRTRDAGKPLDPQSTGFQRSVGFVLDDGDPIAVPHEEDWLEGHPRAIWIELM